MKRVLLVMVSCAMAYGLNAQVKVLDNTPIELKNIEITDAVVPNAQQGKVVTKPAGNSKAAGVTVGSTYYDLQSNSAVQDRIVMNSNGDISAAWTASEENSTSFSDRGTGYSHRDPMTNTWTLSPDYPRIEDARCGWASLLYDGNGGELIVSHTTAGLENLKLNKRSTIGTGTWTQKDVSSDKLTWSRSAMGGTDGNTLHIIAATDTADWASNQNMYRSIVYYRSQDAGSTFDKVHVILPGIDSAAYGQSRTTFGKSTMDIDAYAIAASGNTVAFAIFNRWNDIILMKSTDNGNNWTKTIVNDFPYKNFFEVDNMCDSSHRHLTTDGAGAILIDGNGTAHLSWGQSEVRNNDIDGDESFFLTPFTDSLGYWNETMGADNPSTCGNFVDKNMNNVVDITNLGDYFQGGWLSYPNMSLGADGSVYVVYSAAAEDTVWASDFTSAMRHIYIVRSKDGGTTWSEPTDLTPGEPDLSESVYPDLIDRSDSKIRLIYQHDWHPSVYVPQINGPANPQNYTRQTQATVNDIIYLEVDTTLNVGIEKVISSVGETSLYPNPSEGQVDLTIKVFKDVRVQVYVTNLSGQVVYTYQNTPLKVGKNNVSMDLSGLQAGMYFVNIQAGESILTDKLILK
ncbi:MAG: T9SS type A sorting domain-containing protein [Vicingaceae bacterium]